MKPTLGEMKLAIHQTHDCEATRCIEIVDVTLDGEGVRAKPVKVYLFEIEGHPTAIRCFAWGVEIDERTLIIPAVIQSAGVEDASQAVLSYGTSIRTTVACHKA